MPFFVCVFSCYVFLPLSFSLVRSLNLNSVTLLLSSLHNHTNAYHLHHLLSSIEVRMHAHRTRMREEEGKKEQNIFVYISKNWPQYFFFIISISSHLVLLLPLFPSLVLHAFFVFVDFRISTSIRNDDDHANTISWWCVYFQEEDKRERRNGRCMFWYKRTR